MKTPTLWRAGFVNRWHTNDSHALRNSQDINHAHQGRVALLMWELFPDCTRDDLLSCLVHDLPEKATGDMSGEAKRSNPAWAEMLHDAEMQWLIDADAFVPGNPARRRLCDVLDAYLFARMIDPSLMSRHDWIDQHGRILKMADALGVADKVKEWI